NNACLNAGSTAFDAACPVWHAATGTASWTLTLADSLLADGSSYEVSSRATDHAANVQIALGTDTFSWDGAAPSASFVINSGDAYTQATAATLTLSDATDVAEYRKADGSDCSAASWTAYSGPIS